MWHEAGSVVCRREVQTTRALGIAGVGTHGGRRACTARRLRCALRACGACAWRVRCGLHGRVLGESGSVIAVVGRRAGGERWLAAAARVASGVTPDICRNNFFWRPNTYKRGLPTQPASARAIVSIHMVHPGCTSITSEEGIPDHFLDKACRNCQRSRRHAA